MARFILTAELQLRAPTNTAAILAQIQRQLQGVNTTVNVSVNRQSINQINQINRSLKQTKKSADESADAFEAFGKQAALAIRRFGAFVTATFAFRQLVSSIVSGVKEAIAFERQVVKIAQVTNSAIRDMKDLSGEVTRLSTTLGVSSSKLIEAAQVLAQAGLSAKDTKVALEALAKSELSPTFEDITETTEGAIAIFQQFGKEAKDLEGILGSLNAVSGKFAVESSDLITAVRRTGGAFKAAGGNLDELSALFTSVRATTRESAESIATGFRTIFTRIQRPRTINFLRDLGVELTDLKGQFVGPLEAVRRLSLALEKIPSTDIRFAQVIEELGGFRQVSKVIPLIQQFAISEKALAVAQTGRTSLTEDAIKAQASLAVQIQKVREEFAKLIREFTNDTTFRNLVNLSLNLASALIKVADATRPLAPALAILGSIGLGSAASKAVGSFGSGKGFLGNIFKFASGGKVPGHGTGDTVPAMLEPGEFVLRKQAVKAIGEDNISKFNKGGYVKAYAKGSPGKFTPITDALLKKLGITTDSDIFKSAGVTREQILSTNEDVFKGAILGLQTSRNRPANKVGKSLRDAAFVKTTDKSKKAPPSNIVVGSVTDAMFGGLFLKPIQDRNLSSVAQYPFAKLSGTNQQAVAAHVGSSIGALQNSKVFSKLDFGFVESRTAKRFDVSSRRVLNESVRSLLDKFSPTSSTIPNSVVSNAVKTSNLDGALGSLFEAFTVSLANVDPVDRGKQAAFDISDVTASRGPLTRLFGEIGPNVLATDLKLSATKESTGSIVKKAVEYAVGRSRMDLVKKSQAQIGKSDIEIKTGEAIRPLKRAGGGPSGKDTQPALLTPGEFVLNKDAVDRIGVPTLNKLNKVQKLNKGGVVGRYATGGIVDKLASPSGLLAGSVLLQVSSQFASLNNEVGKLISTVSGAAVQAAIFTTVLKQSSFVTEKASDLEKATAAKEHVQKASNLTTLKQTTERADKLDARSAKSGAAFRAARKDVREAKALSPLTRNIAFPQGLQALEDEEFRTHQSFARDLAQRGAITNAAEARRRLPRAQRRVDVANNREQVAQAALRRNQFIATGAGVAGAVGVAGGDFLSQRGAAAIQGGSTSVGQSVVGGGISGVSQGALAGAAIGSAIPIPVIGTAIGALAGAITGGAIGVVTAWTEASNQIKNVQFGKTVEEFDRTLKKAILTGGGGGEVNRGLNAIATRIRETTGEDRVAAEGAAKSALPDLQQFFDATAKGSRTLDEFRSKVGRDTLNLFSLFSKIPLEEVNKQYQKQIESQEAARKAQVNLSKATDELGVRIRNTTALNRALDDATASLEGFTQSLADTPQGTQDLSGIVGATGGVADVARFNSLTRATGASFGASGSASAADSISAQKILSELPSVLLSLKNIDLFSEDATGNFEDILKDRLAGASGGDPASRSFINIIGARAGGIIGGEGRPQKLIDKLNQDFEGTVKELGSGLEFAAAIVQKEFKAVADSGKFLSDNLAKVTQLTIDSINGFNAALDIQHDIDEFKAGLVPNSRFSAGVTERTVRDQLANTTRGLGVSDVRGLSNILQSSQRGILRTNEAGTADAIAARVDKDGSNLKVIDRQNRVQGADFATQAALAAKALGQIVTSSQKLAAAKQKELDAVEAERKSRLSLAEEFAFGGPEARLSIIENQNIANRISSGNLSVDQLDPASLQRFGQFLDKLNPNSLLASGQSVGQLRESITGQQVIGFMPQLSGGLLSQQGFKELTQGTPEEDKLRGEIIAALEQARESQIALAEAPKALAGQIEIGLAASIKKFDDSIEKFIRAEQEKFNKQEQVKVQAETAAAGNQNRLRNQVSGTLGISIKNKNDLERARKATGLIEELNPIKKKGSAFGKFSLEANRVINDKNLDEKTRQTELLRLAQDNFAGINIGALADSEFIKGREHVTAITGTQEFKPLSATERVGQIESAITAAGGQIGLTKEEQVKKQIIEKQLTDLGVSTENVAKSSANIDTLNKQLNELAAVDFNAINNVASALKTVSGAFSSIGSFFGVQQKAAGGIVSGPNIRRDIMPAMLTPGEFVMRRDAVQRIGVGTLSAMNAGVTGFAAGGFVDPEELKRQLIARKAEQDAKNAAAKQAASQNAAASKAASEAAKADNERIVQQRQAEKAAEFKANQAKNKAIVSQDQASRAEFEDGLTIQQRSAQARNRMAQLEAQHRGKQLLGAFREAGGGAAQGQSALNTTPFGSPSSGFGLAARANTIRSIRKATRESNRVGVAATTTPISSTSGAAAPVAVANTTRTNRTATGQSQPSGVQSIDQVQKVVANFSATIDKFSQALEKFNGMKFEHTINGKVEVIINGDSALNKLSGDFQEMVLAKVSQGINEQVIKPLNIGGKASEVNFSNLSKR